MPRLAIFSAIVATFSLAAASNGCNKADGETYENYRAATPSGGNKCAPTPVPVCEDPRADATLTASELYPTAIVGSKHGGTKACTKAGGAAVTTESNGDLCVGAPPSSPSPPPPPTPPPPLPLPSGRRPAPSRLTAAAEYAAPFACRYAVYGCKDPTAVNYAPHATVEVPAMCQIAGCNDTDAAPWSYNPNVSPPPSALECARPPPTRPPPPAGDIQRRDVRVL